jgi:transposase
VVGHFTTHHAFLIAEPLSHLDYLEAAMDRVSAEIEGRLHEDAAARALLDTVPGIGPRAAQILVAALGTDLSRFPSAKHLASWAGMCPGNKESGGTRLSGTTRKGDRWLRQVLIEIAHVAAKTKDTSLAAQYRRIAARRGKKRALVALGHTILVVVYHILTRREPYRDLGPVYCDQLERQHVEHRLVRRLERLGYTVSLPPTGPSPQVAA